DWCDDGGGAARLATRELVLRGSALSLRNCGWHSLHCLRRILLLVPESLREKTKRNAWKAAFLAIFHWVPPHVRFYACAWNSRDAPADLYVRAGARLGYL